MYLSNVEKEALFLTGYGDVPPWAVQQGLQQALGRGTYVPGEEALRIRLEEQLDLEERLATAGGKTTEQQAEEAEADEFASNLQQGLLEGLEGEHIPFSSFTKTQLLEFALEGFGTGLDETLSQEELRSQVQCLVDQAGGPTAFLRERIAVTDEAGAVIPWPELEEMYKARKAQEAAEEPPADQWRSPLEIVMKGAEEPDQEPPGEEDAAPAPADQRVEDRDFSSFTKAQLVSFAWDQFGVELKRTDSKDELIAQVQQLVDKANG